jgi:hypothetical protein
MVQPFRHEENHHMGSGDERRSGFGNRRGLDRRQWRDMDESSSFEFWDFRE